jgi:hypothetical protein
MSKYGTGVLTLIVSFALGYAASHASYFAPRHTIKQVMRKAHKQGLLKNVLSGNASDEDRRELLSLYLDLAANTPPKGGADSWRDKTTPIINAARAVAAGDPRGPRALKNAVNCGACHREHKD